MCGWALSSTGGGLEGWTFHTKKVGNRTTSTGGIPIWHAPLHTWKCGHTGAVRVRRRQRIVSRRSQCCIQRHVQTVANNVPSIFISLPLDLDNMQLLSNLLRQQQARRALLTRNRKPSAAPLLILLLMRRQPLTLACGAGVVPRGCSTFHVPVQQQLPLESYAIFCQNKKKRAIHLLPERVPYLGGKTACNPTGE